MHSLYFIKRENDSGSAWRRLGWSFGGEKRLLMFSLKGIFGLTWNEILVNLCKNTIFVKPQKGKHKMQVYICICLFLKTYMGGLVYGFCIWFPHTQSKVDFIFIVVVRFLKIAHFIPCKKTNSVFAIAQPFFREVICVV